MYLTLLHLDRFVQLIYHRQGHEYIYSMSSTYFLYNIYLYLLQYFKH